MRDCSKALWVGDLARNDVRWAAYIPRIISCQSNGNVAIRLALARPQFFNSTSPLMACISVCILAKSSLAFFLGNGLMSGSPGGMRSG